MIASEQGICLLLMLIFSPVAFAESTCPSGRPLTEAEMTPQGFHDFLSKNSALLKTKGDVLCCLPKSFREHYLVVHSSEASQNGHPRSPRVLLFPKPNGIGNGQLNVSTPLRMVITVNGSDPNLKQSHNIEMVFNNTKKDELELFDFDTERKSRELKVNPKSCLKCHGDAGFLAVGGPRPIFEGREFWPAVIRGYDPSGPESEKEYVLTEVTKKAVLSDPTFRCLEPKIDDDHQQDPFSHAVGPSNTVFLFDNQLTEMNDRRVAKLIRSTPDYDRFKYIVIGNRLCANDILHNIEGWIPLETLCTFNRDASLAPLVRKSSDLDATYRAEIERMKAEEVELGKRQIQMAKDLRAGLTPIIEVSHNLTGGGCQVDPKKFSDRRPSHPLFGKYFLDSELKLNCSEDQGVGRETVPEGNAILRFLFEARGISLASLSTDPHPSTGRSLSGRFLAELLLAAEPKNSPLKPIEKQLKNGGLLDARVLQVIEFSVPTATHLPRVEVTRLDVCKKLKALSYTALKGQDFVTQRVDKGPGDGKECPTSKTPSPFNGFTPANQIQGVDEVVAQVNQKSSMEIYRVYCAKCHDGSDESNKDLQIHTVEDMQKYRSDRGESLIDMIRNNQMPFDRASFDSVKAAQWEQDRALLLEVLEYKKSKK